MKLGASHIAGTQWAADFAVATVIGGFLGLIGPFGSFFNGPVWQRGIYWVAMAWLGLVVFRLFSRSLLGRAGSPRTAWMVLGAYAVFVSVPLGIVSWTLARAIWPMLGHAPGLTPAAWYFQSLIITAPQVALLAVLSRLGRGVDRPSRFPPPSPDLLGVSPGEVVCLQMEDHYVRVHTIAGSRLVLATLAQAMAALDRTPGLRVHRSWWVADKAVAGAVAEGRKLRLILTTGVKAPVARSSVAAVREAGWLHRPPEPGGTQKARETASATEQQHPSVARAVRSKRGSIDLPPRQSG